MGLSCHTETKLKVLCQVPQFQLLTCSKDWNATGRNQAWVCFTVLYGKVPRNRHVFELQAELTSQEAPGGN